jgi:hypothetical protein
MVAMLAPPGVSPGATFKVLSGATYTVDANLFVAVTSQVDAVNLQNMGFYQVPFGRLNLTATTDPGSGNDTSQDYAAGSMWINVTLGRVWIAQSVALGAAVWLLSSLGTTPGTVTLTNLVLTALLTRSSATGITAFSGGGQASATQLATEFSNITTATASSAPYDSVKPNAVMAAGQKRLIANNAANPVQFFGFSTDTVNGFASGTGVTLPAGFIGEVVCPVAGALQIRGLPNFTTDIVYNTNAATSGTTLTGANLTGGINEVILNLTGTLGGDANAQLPTVGNLVTAFPNAVAGESYKLRIINSSSANHVWTITTNTGWTLNGTMTLAQNTWRDFIVTLTTTSAAVLQQIGTGTTS